MISRVLSKLTSVLFSSPAKEETAVSQDNLEDGWSWIPKWQEIFNGQSDDWAAAVEKARSGPKVLIATCTGGNSTLTPIEAILAVALTLRGARVEILLCDKAIPACMNVAATDSHSQEKFLQEGPDKCTWCFESGYGAFKELGLPVQLLSQWISADDRLQAKQIVESQSIESAGVYSEDGMAIGEHAMAGAIRYLARGDFENEPLALDIVRRYLEAAIISKRAVQRLYAQQGYQHTVVNHGFYVPQGLVVGAARQYHSSVATWSTAYRSKCILIDGGDTFVRTIFEEDNALWDAIPWTEEMEAEIVDYLKSRWKGTYDWMKVQNSQSSEDVVEIEKQLGIDFSKPTIGLLTNVIWDAQVLYPGNAFPNMLDWMIKTIRYFESRPDMQLLIRVHPGELKGWLISRQLAVDEISKAFPALPANVFVVPPESPINTYAAMSACNSVLIYGTTAGLELACMGMPVIVAGEAWIRNKGIGYDASSEAEYFSLLKQLPLAENRLSDEKIQRSLKYAYHTYFRKMIPLDMLQPQSSQYVPYTIKPVGVDGFRPGHDAGLDVICRGILENSAFIYPHESVGKKLDAVSAVDILGNFAPPILG